MTETITPLESDEYDPKPAKPEFTGMKDFGAIGVFDNFVDPQFCDSLVDLFEYWYTGWHPRTFGTEGSVSGE